MVSHVAVSQQRREPWNCVWCGESNTGYSRQRDPAAATLAALAADVTSRGLAFAPPDPVSLRGAARDQQPVLIVTSNDIPGYRITEVHGDVFGLIVRARNIFTRSS